MNEDKLKKLEEIESMKNLLGFSILADGANTNHVEWLISEIKAAWEREAHLTERMNDIIDELVKLGDQNKKYREALEE